MVELTNKAPGVYIEEIQPTGPIAGVSTSTAAFIGETVKAEKAGKSPDNTPTSLVGTPTLVTNWTQYKTFFGEFGDRSGSNPKRRLYLPHAVRGFFDNGGTMAYVVSLGGLPTTPPTPPATSPTIGVDDYVKALTALERVDGVNMVCVPDADGIPDIQQKVLTHCEKLADRFAIFDPAPNNMNDADPGTTAVQVQRPKLDSKSGFAALYFPWIVINDPLSPGGNGHISVPPSGHLAGVYARVDNARGVHKAPANEFINGAVDLERIINDTDQGIINALGINALRIFPGQGRPIVWGARTTALKDDLPFRYVNVRRLFMYVEKSIQVGIRWAIFEPNDLSLWKKLERTIHEFLTRVWLSGALFGKTASEAFYVKIDEELNPPDKRKLGIVTIEIGIAPVRPAEFIVVQIGMWDGGTKVNEK